VVALDMTFESVSVGHTGARSGGVHACGVATGGSAYCWGSRWEAMGGSLGVSEVSVTPVPVLGVLSFANISTGSGPTCGIVVGLTRCGAQSGQRFSTDRR